jgi:hypothetical protein
MKFLIVLLVMMSTSLSMAANKTKRKPSDEGMPSGNWQCSADGSGKMSFLYVRKNGTSKSATIENVAKADNVDGITGCYTASITWESGTHWDQATCCPAGSN